MATHKKTLKHYQRLWLQTILNCTSLCMYYLNRIDKKVVKKVLESNSYDTIEQDRLNDIGRYYTELQTTDSFYHDFKIEVSK